MAGGRKFDLLPTAIAPAILGRTVVHAAAPLFRTVEPAGAVLGAP